MVMGEIERGWWYLTEMSGGVVFGNAIRPLYLGFGAKSVKGDCPATG
jgi:hypothetical protein